MDIFKQNRYLIFVIILLVILNIGTLSMLWFGKSQRPAHLPDRQHPENERVRLQELLQSELGFDEAQVEQYLHLRREHREKIDHLNTEIRRVKRQMFDEVLAENPQPTISDSLLNLAQEKQAQIEKLTFRHFLDLKKLCKPEQQDKLRLLMHELFRQPHPGGDAGHQPPGRRLPGRDRPNN
ncbi:periplasmic heavy metal sensor [candidate division KSB1 bacterium]|nr:periplasmic heavy metal sensor [candidate division KSB1 bacterium]